MLTRSDECSRPGGWALTCPRRHELNSAHADTNRTDYSAAILSEEIPEFHVRGRRVQARFMIRRVCRREARGDAAVARLVPL
jgi:hypothetical protein